MTSLLTCATGPSGSKQTEPPDRTRDKKRSKHNEYDRRLCVSTRCGQERATDVVVPSAGTAAPGTASLPALLASGLRGGLLTYGGAYTAIPFLQQDAVVRGGWMINGQFLDDIALSGILPAPLIIFSTFVGYVGVDRWAHWR